MSATASQPFFTKLLGSRREVCGTVFRGMYCRHMSLSQKTRASVSLQGSAKQVQACTHYITGTTSKNQDKASLNFLRDKKILPDSDPPSGDDVNLLYQFINHSHKLMVLTGAGISTESGIPDYRRCCYLDFFLFSTWKLKKSWKYNLKPEFPLCCYAVKNNYQK
eukprot:TRINITY_DN5628_c0_g1_i9.p1 TRINITY_DN5628_c0_g1~~TRINITY_DN5628_c0_g1_i9.p1  ORF type:complete len:164 (-),score=15.02 TRINITY_DN5628_c0_g1_i9:111-602(-)